MKSWQSSFFAFLILGLLAACGGPSYQETVYSLPATPGAHLCATQCTEARDYCRQGCDLENRACYNSVQAKAQEEYDRYARERFANHLTVDLLPSDFEHADSCVVEKKSCFASCDKPYNSCYRACGGMITVTSSCQFMCFE